MSDISYRAALVREIEQTMKRTAREPVGDSHDLEFLNGKMDAYAHILTIVKDEDL